MDSPGLSPSDIRARRLKIVTRAEEIENNPDEIIWRVTYSCNGCCKALPGPTQSLRPSLSTKDTFASELLAFAKGVKKSGSTEEKDREAAQAPNQEPSRQSAGSDNIDASEHESSPPTDEDQDELESSDHTPAKSSCVCRSLLMVSRLRYRCDEDADVAGGNDQCPEPVRRVLYAVAEAVTSSVTSTRSAPTMLAIRATLFERGRHHVLDDQGEIEELCLRFLDPTNSADDRVSNEDVWTGPTCPLAPIGSIPLCRSLAKSQRLDRGHVRSYQSVAHQS